MTAESYVLEATGENFHQVLLDTVAPDDQRVRRFRQTLFNH